MNACIPVDKEESKGWHFQISNQPDSSRNPEMPRPAYDGELDNLTAPTMVIAAKGDILFPASRVIPRAKAIFPNLVYSETIDGLHEPTEEAYKHIIAKSIEFFNG